MKINKYGVFQVKTKRKSKAADDENEEVYLAGCTEEEIYAGAGTAVDRAELREDRWEFESAAITTNCQSSTAALRSNLHMHTNET